MDLLPIAWKLSLAAWLLGIFEMIAMHTFAKPFFKVGIPLFRHYLDFPGSHFSVEGNKLHKSEGKFLFTSKKVYFLSRFRFQFQTIFPVKATGSITNNNQVYIIGRIPFGPVLFFLVWLSVWTIILGRVVLNSPGTPAIGYLIIGWIFVVFLAGLSYFVERRRMRTMMTELQQIIQEPK